MDQELHCFLLVENQWRIHRGGLYGGGVYQYPIPLEVNRKVSHIPLSKLENIPLIKFPKYPVSLEVNKKSLKLSTQNRPTSTGTFCQAQTSCNGLCSKTLRILIAIECSISST